MEQPVKYYRNPDEPISLEDLKSFLWGAATRLRGQIDAAGYKEYIFPLLFSVMNNLLLMLICSLRKDASPSSSILSFTSFWNTYGLSRAFSLSLLTTLGVYPPVI